MLVKTDIFGSQQSFDNVGRDLFILDWRAVLAEVFPYQYTVSRIYFRSQFTSRVFQKFKARSLSKQPEYIFTDGKYKEYKK
jgi:hypothetical protein